MGTNGGSEPPSETEPNPLDTVTTGLPWLDRWLGGLTPGSVVAIVADPDSPSEELLYPVAATNPSRYLSILRPAAEVERHAMVTGRGEVEVTGTTSATLLDDPAGALSGLVPESVIIIDPATELEREGRDRYLSFLETLKRAVETTESVAILHCPRMNPRALQRDLTLSRVDTVLNLERYVGEGHGVPQSRWVLTATKSRFGRLPTDGLPVGFEHGPISAQSRER
jgi:hypothetical protein